MQMLFAVSLQIC